MAVLRHAENALVREMTVQVMSQAVSTNPKGLGSGGRNPPSEVSCHAVPITAVSI